jgi:polysaccharide pyruvyl transferase WcaK-like protein
MAKRQIRVALLGLFGIDNYGNEGSLAAMLYHLRKAYPDGQLSSICTCPQRVEKDHQIPAFPMSTQSPPRSEHLVLRIAVKLFLRLPREIAAWLRTIVFLRRVERLVIPGTGVLDDFGLSPFNIPYDIFRWCVCARLSGTPVLFVSIGAGPINNDLSRWFMKTAARVADYRSYRDHISRNFMTSIGVDTSSDSVYPDLAFSLPLPAATGSSPLPGKPCTVGVGVMTYYGWRNDPESGAAIFRTYLDNITRFVLWLLSQGHSVRLIVGDSCDSLAATHVISEVTEKSDMLSDGQFVAGTMESLNDVLRELAATDVVVATRFHNVVCALMLDKPVISLGYAEKNDVLLAEMGLSKFCQHIERFDLATLISHFCEVRDNWKHFESEVRKRRDHYRRQLGEQFDTLFPVR